MNRSSVRKDEMELKRRIIRLPGIVLQSSSVPGKEIFPGHPARRASGTCRGIHARFQAVCRWFEIKFLKMENFMPILRKTASGLILAGGLILLNTGCRQPMPVQKQTRFLMDTICTIQASGDHQVLAAIEEAFDGMAAVEKKFSAQDTSSPVFRFNCWNMPITDPEIVDLVEKALEINRESEGAFDITVEPLLECWGFYGDAPHVPDPEALKACLTRIGSEEVVCSQGMVWKRNPRVEIDLGGIAKGYAIAAAKRILESHGVQSALIDAGGDLYAMGRNRRKAWKIGIRNPRGEGVVGVLEVDNLAVVTSGDYERFFEEDGVRYHHLIDPVAGMPARGLSSMTVVSEDPVLADAWSTAFFVMGKEKSLKYAETHELFNVVAIDENGRIFSSAKFGEN